MRHAEKMRDAWAKAADFPEHPVNVEVDRGPNQKPLKTTTRSAAYAMVDGQAYVLVENSRDAHNLVNVRVVA